MICADAFAKDHVLSRSLCYMGADVILSPASWAVPPDHNNETDPYGVAWRGFYMPVAREFAVWIAAASNVGPIIAGPWKNWSTIGCSMLIDPDGEQRLSGPYGANAEKILYHTIQPRPRPARGTDWSKFKPASN